MEVEDEKKTAAAVGDENDDENKDSTEGDSDNLIWVET